MSDGTTLNTATELNSFVYNTVAGWCGRTACCYLRTTAAVCGV